MVEGWLEWLIFDQEPLVRTELHMRGLQPFLEPSATLRDVRRAGIIRSVGEPQRDIAAAQMLRDRYAVPHVRDRMLPDVRIRVAERSELVDLILKEVGVD